MRAAVIEVAGGPEVLKLQERPVPKPETGWALVRVKAFGINRSELFTRQGHSPSVLFPRILGIEAVGQVVEAPGGEFPKEGSAQNRANLYAKRFRVGACWIGAGIDRYEDELEFPRWTSIHASSSPRRPGCAPRISGSYARHDDLTTNLAWRTRSPSSGSRGGRRASNLSRSSRTSWVMWQRS